MNIEEIKKIAKVSKREQIVAILSRRTTQLVSRLPEPNLVIDHLRFIDFIDVTVEDLISYVKENGFPADNVSEEGGKYPFHGDDQHRIEKVGSGWELYSAERGEKIDAQQFDNLQLAREALIKMLYRSAKITLNHRYWHAHPEQKALSAEDF